MPDATEYAHLPFHQRISWLRRLERMSRFLDPIIERTTRIGWLESERF